MSLLSVSEAVAETGLSAHTLRYYEKEMLLLEVPRDAGGRRFYTKELIAALKFISALRATGMPIQGIKDYIDLYSLGEHTAPDRMDLLKAHEEIVKKQLQETKDSLQLIRKKICFYEETLATRAAASNRA